MELGVKEMWSQLAGGHGSYNRLVGVLVVIVSLAVFYLKSRGSKKRLPPGPKGWPLVGNLFQVAFSGKPFMYVVRDLREQFGSIFTLQMGQKTLVIITCPEVAHEALIEKGTLFANRPPDTPTKLYFSANKCSVNSAEYGSVWRTLRRNLVSEMLNLSRIKDFSWIREWAIDRLIQRLEAEAGSFASSEAPEQVRQVHAKVIEYGLESDVVVGNALVTVYAKCEHIRDAEMVFETMNAPDLVSWNAMIAGYAYNGYTEQALRFFTQMTQMGMMIDKFTLTSILSACGNPGVLQQGKGVHAHAMKIGLESETPVRNALITMYLTSGCVEYASKVFNSMTKRDVVSWNALIAGYAHHGHGEEALKFYCQMQHTCTRQDKFTFSSVLRACASLAALEQGKQVHAQIAQTGFVMDAFVGSAIVYMYGKCGVIEYAGKVFDETSKQCAVSWNAMIAGYAQHGHCKKALQLFEQMQEAGMKPDHITFVSVLSACSHAGLVDEGICYFNSMKCNHGIPPRMEHYACTVDILGRAGHLEEAMDFINKMPFKPDGTVWRTLLGACATYGNIELGIHAAKFLLELEPQEDVAYVLMSNIYAAAGRWDDCAKMRKMMREKGLKKEPGCSWIEIKNTVHTFNAEDRSHPQTEEIYLKLEELMGKMKAAGYVPNTNFLMHDV